MKITTWNVNSLKVRLPHVLEYLAQEKPDVLALQETKQQDKDFPQSTFEDAGYHVEFSGQKTYNGVAIISKHPMQDVVMNLPNLKDPQRRLLAATVGGVRVIDVYIPNGQEVGCDKYEYKFRWLHALREFLITELQHHQTLVLLGDYNIAPADLDIHDPSRWVEKIMCSTPEREWFDALMDLGLYDTLRQQYPNEAMHSWWDYRMNAFRRGWGIRIDHILATKDLQIQAGGIHTDYRAKERPSDHAPVWALLSETL
ncbi:MAG: exodeoxyribonuclease III [Mariprofundaceae bacterium]|nr:exodeoxyribonuclease III [Mariprofundaceae bacterium]